MRTIFKFLILNLSCIIFFSSSGLAVNNTIYYQKQVCDPKGPDGLSRININKVLSITNAEIPTSAMAGPNGDILYKTRVEAALSKKNDFASDIIEFILFPNEKYYKITKKGGGKVKARHFLHNPSQYEALCVNYPPNADQQTPTIREQLDSFSKKVGKNFVVRENIEFFKDTIKIGQPAFVSVLRDNLKKNTNVKTSIAVAQKYERFLPNPFNQSEATIDQIPVTLYPYFRYDGSFNSDSKRQDIDNLAVGLRADVKTKIEPLISGNLSFRGEYLTDSEAESEIFASEIVWSPIFTGALTNVIPLQKRVPLSDIDEGPWIYMDASVRYRHGEVVDPGEKNVIRETDHYQRVGGRFHALMGIDGIDILSGWQFRLTYWYFENLKEASTIGSFDHLKAALNYKITQNFGLELSYTEGRNVDTLEAIDQLYASFTFKFGEFSE